VFVHGWPDSVDMWTPLVERLAKQGHRCVCVPLPWYPGGSDPAKRPDFNVAARDVVFAARQATKTSQNENENEFTRAGVHKVTLVCHDWGCVVGFKVQKMVPDLVEAVVALDVGADANGLSAKEKAFVVAYQSWLAAAHVIGGGVGDYMTTAFARFAGAPVTKRDTKTKTKTVVRASLNWPYVAFWRDLMFPRRERFWTGDEAAPRAFRSSTPNEKKTSIKNGPHAKNKIAGDGNAPESFPFAPSCPVLFLFGGNKPARFHGDAWLKAIDAKKAGGDGSAWYEMNGAGHWFPVERVDETFDALDAWFRATKKKENDVETSDSPTPSEIRSAL
jgi:pimeloyl-ACP methyl ester carboxylesterase